MAEIPPSDLLNPRHHQTIVETNYQFHLHANLASGTDNLAYQHRRVFTKYHAVDQLGRPTLGFKFGFKNK